MRTTLSVDVDFLNSLMKVKGLSESEFAETIGVSHSMVNRIMNKKRGAGNKVIHGILSAFPDVSYGQLVSSDRALPKGNKASKKSA